MNIKAWNDTVKDINAHIELEGCMKVSMERIADLLEVEKASLMLLDKENQELSIRVAKGLAEDIIKNTRTKVGEGVSGWVAKNKKSLLVKDIGSDKRFEKREGRYHNSSLLSVPLVAGDELLGVINVNNKTTRRVFGKKDLTVLNDIAVHVSSAIDRAIKYEEAQRLSQIKLDFVSTVSHELRSPLASVKEAMNLLLDKIPGKINPDQERFLFISRNNVDRVLRLI